MRCVFVLLLLPALILSLSSPVAWQPSSLIQTSTSAVISTGTPALFAGTNNFTLTFAQSFVLAPTVGMVLTKITQTIPSPTMAVFIIGILPQQSSVNLTLDFKTGNTFSLVSVGFIAIDSSISYATYSSGNIVDSEYIPYLNLVNTSHSLSVIGYLVGFSIDTSALGSGGSFNVQIKATLYNSSCCFVNKTQDNLTFSLNYSTSVGILLVDLTLAQTEKTHYFDFDPGFQSLGVSTTHSTFLYSGISTLLAGINGFNIPNGQYFSFSFDPISLQLGSSTAYTSLTVGICNIRFRACLSGTPLFMESNLTCYDSCPISYYAFPVFSYCSPCDYTCLTCTNSLMCSTCEASSRRYLQVTGSTLGVDFGKCLCKDYYYDDLSNRLCKTCHYSCQHCEDSSQTSCLSCNKNDNRYFNPLRTIDLSLHTLAGQCLCEPGFYNNGASICPKCDYTCITCADQNTCLTCPNTRTLDPNSNSCVCMVGYADYGNPVCEKQYNFRVASSVLYLSFIGSLFFFIVDRFKIQHIETIWVFQLAFFTSSVLGANSAYSPFTTLSPIVNGYNRLSNAEFNTISLSVPLQPLGIRTIFIGNANIMPAFALGVFLLGFLIWVINKVLVIIPDLFMTVSHYCMHDGVFSIVLFNTLNVFFSFGSQVDSYIQMTQITLSSIVLNWIYIIILCLLQGWVFYRYLVDYQKFGVMNQALKKDPLSLRHPLVMGLTRTIEGFSLGIGYDWKIIPLEILAIQLIAIVYMILKRPYKSKLDMSLAVTNQAIILVIVLLMALQSQGMFLETPQRLLVSWIQTGLALLAFVKSGVIYYFKTYKHYMSTKHDRMPQVKMEGLANTQNMMRTSHNFNDNDSVVENEEVVGIKKRKDTI